MGHDEGPDDCQALVISAFHQSNPDHLESPNHDVDADDRCRMTAFTVATKPRLRGWIHVYCAAAAFGGRFGTGDACRGRSPPGSPAHATLAYTLAIVAMFGVSATYHRVRVGLRCLVRAWMRRLDHSMIYVFIAGTYTPFARLDMPRPTGHVVLAIVWGAALAGIAVMLFWPDAPTLVERDALLAVGMGRCLVHRIHPAQRGRR